MGLAEASGVPVIIDSSKDLADLAVIGRVPGTDSALVHLTRDPRAAIHSRARSRRQRVAAGRHPNPAAARLRPVLAAGDAVLWLATERACHRAAARASRATTLDYEDWAAHPRARSGELAAWAGFPTIPNRPGPFLDNQTGALPSRHIVSGNRNRLVTGPVTISPDDRWVDEMPALDKAVVSAVTGGRAQSQPRSRSSNL